MAINLRLTVWEPGLSSLYANSPTKYGMTVLSSSSKEPAIACRAQPATPADMSYRVACHRYTWRDAFSSHPT